MNERHLIHFIDRAGNRDSQLVRVAVAAGCWPLVYRSVEELCSARPSDGIVIASDDPPRCGVIHAFEMMTAARIWLPLIAVSEKPIAARVVSAIKAGVFDYLKLPLQEEWLRGAIRRIRTEAEAHVRSLRRRIEARSRIGKLSLRERQVLDRLACGGSNKVIARDLNISPRTVEIYRANMMAKLHAAHSAEAVRMRVEAQLDDRSTERA